MVGNLKYCLMRADQKSNSSDGYNTDGKIILISKSCVQYQGQDCLFVVAVCMAISKQLLPDSLMVKCFSSLPFMISRGYWGPVLPKYPSFHGATWSGGKMSTW